MLKLRIFIQVFFLLLLACNKNLLAKDSYSEEIELRNNAILKNEKPKGLPNFFPVEFNRSTKKSMLVLPFLCASDQVVEWDKRYESFIGELKPGSSIKAYTKDGTYVDGLLGSAQCFIGACRANYVSLPIETDTEIKEIKVVSKPISITTSSVEISSPVDCENLPLKKEDPHGYGFEALPTTCNEILDSSNDNKILGQLIAFGWMQGNGWDVYEQFYRSVNVGPDGEHSFGELIDIAYSSGNTQYPLFQFTKDKGVKSLLWYEKNGLGPVSAFTLRESVIDEAGKIEWLTKYQAGGQPCD